jgi:alcohol dehydrogenase class IV
MKNSIFYMPTQVRFGQRKLEELKDILPAYGKRGLLVSRPANGSLHETYDRLNKMLKGSGVELFHYDKVVPNPTTTGVEEGIVAAKENHVDFVLGVGGGSTMDTAKLIAFLYNEEAVVDWDDAMSKYDNPFAVGPSPDGALPLIAVSTTSGSGSQCTQAAVVSDLKQKSKITLFHSGLFPSVSIVDPELMLSVPAMVTAATGFDAFAHAFESFLGSRTSPLTESMSMQVISSVFENLPRVIQNPEDIEARVSMAWADTIAGMCLANGGADLPHPLGEVIGGICPWISHGDTLAIVYPEFLKYKKTIAPEKFEQVESVLSVKNGSKPLLEHVNLLFSVVNLDTALERAGLNAEHKQEMESHPLLDVLQPANKEQIKNIMIKSLEQ